MTGAWLAEYVDHERVTFPPEEGIVRLVVGFLPGARARTFHVRAVPVLTLAVVMAA